MVLITWLCEFNKLNSFWFILWKKVRVRGNHKILLFTFKNKKKKDKSLISSFIIRASMFVLVLEIEMVKE